MGTSTLSPSTVNSCQSRASLFATSKVAFWILFAAVLAGCATPAEQSAMRIDSSDRAKYSPDTRLAGEVIVDRVIGGTDTNPAWTSQIGSLEFKKALEDSLETAFLLGSFQDAGYTVDVELLKVDQPMFGFNFTVNSEIIYTVRDRQSNRIILEERITADGTAGTDDALMGAKRLRLATEKSAKNNIEKFLQQFMRFAEREM